jgi:hypothetical protein
MLALSLGTAVLAGIGVFVVRGITRHVTLTVRNDSALVVRIADCVDGSAQNVNPGETFTAEGSPPHDRLPCLIGNGSGRSRCFVIPHVRSVKGTYPLSRLVAVAESECS